MKIDFLTVSDAIFYHFSRRSPSEIQLCLEQGFEELKKYEGTPSLLQQHLTQEAFDTLKELKTSFKSNLLDCIQSGKYIYN